MKKLHITYTSLLVSILLIGFTSLPTLAQAVVNDSAGLNDIQSQGSSTVQNNSLSQGASNISSGTSGGSTDLLKGKSKQDSLTVSGAPANTSTEPVADTSNASWIAFSVTVLLVITAPLVLIWINAKNNNVATPVKKPKAKKAEPKDAAEELTPEEKALLKEVEVKQTKPKAKKVKNANKSKRKKKKR